MFLDVAYAVRDPAAADGVRRPGRGRGAAACRRTARPATVGPAGPGEHLRRPDRAEPLHPAGHGVHRQLRRPGRDGPRHRARRSPQVLPAARACRTRRGRRRAARRSPRGRASGTVPAAPGRPRRVRDGRPVVGDPQLGGRSAAPACGVATARRGRRSTPTPRARTRRPRPPSSSGWTCSPRSAGRPTTARPAAGEASPGAVRTFGLARFGWPRAEVVARAARVVAPVLVNHWVTPDPRQVRQVIPAGRPTSGPGSGSTRTG